MSLNINKVLTWPTALEYQVNAALCDLTQVPPCCKLLASPLDSLASCALNTLWKSPASGDKTGFRNIKKKKHVPANHQQNVWGRDVGFVGDRMWELSSASIWAYTAGRRYGHHITTLTWKWSRQGCNQRKDTQMNRSAIPLRNLFKGRDNTAGRRDVVRC